jgi:hypothetical protein
MKYNLIKYYINIPYQIDILLQIYMFEYQRASKSEATRCHRSKGSCYECELAWRGGVLVFWCSGVLLFCRSNRTSETPERVMSELIVMSSEVMSRTTRIKDKINTEKR